MRIRRILTALCALLLGGALHADAQGAPAADTSAAAVVREYMRAYNAHDMAGVAARLAPGFTWFNVAGDSTMVELRGRDAVRQALERYFASLPSARSEIESLTTLGPWVSVRERAHWDSPEGARSQASLSVYEVRDGAILRVWYFPSVR